MHNQKSLKIMVYLFYKNNLIIHLKEQKFNDKNCHCITQFFLFSLTHVCRKKKQEHSQTLTKSNIRHKQVSEHV